MPAVSNALVIGAGAAGTAAAILLAEGGVQVEVAEINPEVSALGSGITLQGNALRVLAQLGVYDECAAHGYGFSSLGLRAPDPAGSLIVEMQEISSGLPGQPATMGMFRPELARILVRRAESLGVRFRFGSTINALRQDDEGVDVHFADGEDARYDVVVGADGIRSWTRRMLGIQLETRPVGMGIWRAFAPRPYSVTWTDLYYGGPQYIAGYCPTGEDSLYAYIVEAAQDRSMLTPEDALKVMVEESQAYHWPWDDIRPLITDPEQVNYTWFEYHVLESAWNRGRVALIGDAVHVCPPTIAQGAALALEDAVVLADVLLRHDQVSSSMWEEFNQRRIPRATFVAEASQQLAQWLLDHEQGDVPALLASVVQLVSQPV